MNEDPQNQLQNVTGTTGDADAQIVPGAPVEGEHGTTSDDPVLPAVKSDDVSLTYPDPHDVQPGYGVTGKFPTQDADVADAGDSGGELVVSGPASETDALAVGAPAPVTVEQPAAEADQLDVPAEQRGDTA